MLNPRKNTILLPILKFKNAQITHQKHHVYAYLFIFREYLIPRITSLALSLKVSTKFDVIFISTSIKVVQLENSKKEVFARVQEHVMPTIN